MHVGGATTASDDHRAHVAPSHLWLYVDQGQRADSIRIRHLQGTVEEVSFKLLVFQLLLSYSYFFISVRVTVTVTNFLFQLPSVTVTVISVTFQLPASFQSQLQLLI